MGEDFLDKKINERKEQNSYRQLILPKSGMIDFCSNDYLGIVKNDLIKTPGKYQSGSTGSRLLTGNYKLIEETEQFIANFHNAEAGLIFNSGYDANVGLLSSVPQRGDTVLYDYLSHASIRDGIRLSFAQSFSFLHNDLNDLEGRLKKVPVTTGRNIFVVTESIFSMDGDLCPLKELVTVCEKYNANLIVDEAHATGIIGEKGEGLVQSLNLESKIFARIHTFGKAIGCHGAIVLGSVTLRNYLINFARSFIYSTSLPPGTIAQVKASYDLFPSLIKERDHLKKLISTIHQSSMKDRFIFSQTPIQGMVIPGNEQAKKAARLLQDNKLDIRPILYPTVPKNKERLRIGLHSFNTENELDLLLNSVEKCF